MKLSKKEIGLMEEAFKAGANIQSVAESKLGIKVKTFWGWRDAYTTEVLDVNKNFDNWLKWRKKQ